MRGHVRKRRTWEFIVDVGPHPVTGKRRQKSKSGFATKKEAETALREFIRYVEGGGDPCPDRITLATHLNRWIDDQQARGIRSRTLEAYEGYFRREIIPLIGGLELSKLKPGHIRAVLAGMQRRGLSAATITQTRSALGSALRQALEDGLIPANPVAAVKRPKLRRPEVHWPTPVQLAALIAASKDTIWEIPVLLAAVTGHVAPRSSASHGRTSTSPPGPSPFAAVSSVCRAPNTESRPPSPRSRPSGRIERSPCLHSRSIACAATAASNSSTTASSDPRGATRWIPAVCRFLSCAPARMATSCTPTPSPMRSNGSCERRVCIPRPDCTTSATRSRPSSGGAAFIP
jgi:hypothetical protein